MNLYLVIDKGESDLIQLVLEMMHPVLSTLHVSQCRKALSSSSGSMNCNGLPIQDLLLLPYIKPFLTLMFSLKKQYHIHNDHFQFYWNKFYENIAINTQNTNAMLDIGVMISLSILLFDIRFANVFRAKNMLKPQINSVELTLMVTVTSFVC